MARISSPARRPPRSAGSPGNTEVTLTATAPGSVLTPIRRWPLWIASAARRQRRPPVIRKITEIRDARAYRSKRNGVFSKRIAVQSQILPHLRTPLYPSAPTGADRDSRRTNAVLALVWRPSAADLRYHRRSLPRGLSDAAPSSLLPIRRRHFGCRVFGARPPPGQLSGRGLSAPCGRHLDGAARRVPHGGSDGGAVSGHAPVRLAAGYAGADRRAGRADPRAERRRHRAREHPGDHRRHRRPGRRGGRDPDTRRRGASARAALAAD